MIRVRAAEFDAKMDTITIVAKSRKKVARADVT